MTQGQAGIIRLTHDQLRDLLGLDKSVRVERVQSSVTCFDAIDIVVRGGDLPVVTQGAVIPWVEPRVTFRPPA